MCDNDWLINGKNKKSNARNIRVLNLLHLALVIKTKDYLVS